MPYQKGMQSLPPRRDLAVVYNTTIKKTLIYPFCTK